jgi:hypothetical protein
VEKRDVAIDLTRDEVFKLMRSAAQELLSGLENPYRIDTGAAIKRLNELQAVMPPYKPPADEGWPKRSDNVCLAPKNKISGEYWALYRARPAEQFSSVRRNPCGR